jgi:DHA2 family multidrug resistance protein
VPLLGGGAMLAAFAAYELRRSEPLLDMRALIDRSFRSGVGVQVLAGMSLNGAIFLVPVFTQQVQGLGPSASGMLLLAQGCGVAVALPFSGILTDRVGSRRVVLAGLVMIVVAGALNARVGAGTDILAWVEILSLRGFGMGLTMTSSVAGTYATLPAGARGRATSLMNTTLPLSSALGITLLSIVIDGRSLFYMHEGLPPLKAAALGFDDAFWVTVGLALLAVPAAVGLAKVRLSPVKPQ